MYIYEGSKKVKEILKLAYEYRDCKLWKRINEDRFFAIRLDNGKLAYINIMGKNLPYMAINMQIGYYGLYQIELIYNNDVFGEYEDFANMMEASFKQLIFGNKSDVLEEEYELVRDFKKEEGLKAGGANSFAYFRKSNSFEGIEKIEDKDDFEEIKQAIKACIDLNSMLKEKSLDELGIFDYDKAQTIALLTLVGKNYRITDYLDKEEIIKSQFPKVKIDKKLVKKLNTIKPRGFIDSYLLISPVPMEDEGRIYSPQILLTVNEEGLILGPPVISKNYKENRSGFLNDYLKLLNTNKINPEKIRVGDERTYLLLKSLEDDTNIKIEYTYDLDLLYEARDSYLDSFMSDYDEDENIVMVRSAINSIFYDYKDRMYQMPRELVEEILSILSLDILSIEESKEIMDKIRFTKYYQETYGGSL